jgi:hypothetical protein
MLFACNLVRQLSIVFVLPHFVEGNRDIIGKKATLRRRPFTDNICGPLVKHLKMRQFPRNSKPYDLVR